jgi:hypothetical protein
MAQPTDKKEARKLVGVQSEPEPKRVRLYAE